MLDISDKIPYERKNVFFNFIEYEDYIWFWDVIYNALYCCKKGEKITQRITPKIDFSIFSLYSKVFLYHSKIICEPRMTDKVLIYDIEKKEIRYVCLEINDWKCSEWDEGIFWDGIVSGKYLYLIGLCSPYIIKFDMEAEKTERVIKPYQKTKNYEQMKYYYWKAEISNDILFVPSYRDNLIFLIDIDKMTYFEKYFVTLKKGGFSSLYVSGESIWLFSQFDKRIICWNYETNAIKYYAQYPEKYDLSICPEIGFIHEIDEKLFLFSLQNNKILILDKKNEKLLFEKKINSYYDELLNGRDFNGTAYSFVQRQNRYLYIFLNYSREVLIFSADNENIYSQSFYVPEVDYKDFIFYFFQKETFSIEKNNGLKYLLEFMLNRNNLNIEVNYSKFIGKGIFEEINENSNKKNY